MLHLIQVLVLAVVQGITEFVPVSSDGHLAVVMAVFEQAGHPVSENALGVTILLHVGTLAAIVVYFWQRIWRMLGEDRHVIGLIVVGTLPAVAIGLAAKKLFEEQLGSALLTGPLLVLNGAMLWWASRRAAGETDYPAATWRQALTIGLAQATAILPGISRSGTTIAAGIASGLRRDSAANFSFLLALPAVGGACLLEAVDAWQRGGLAIPVGHAIAGVASSFVVGLLALGWLMSWLQRGRLIYFAWWCLGLGAAVTVWQSMRVAGV